MSKIARPTNVLISKYKNNANDIMFSYNVSQKNNCISVLFKNASFHLSAQIDADIKEKTYAFALFEQKYVYCFI